MRSTHQNERLRNCKSSLEKIFAWLVRASLRDGDMSDHPVSQKWPDLIGDIERIKDPDISVNTAYLLHLADCIADTSGVDNIQRLLDDLVQVGCYQSTYHELVVCAGYARRGYAVKVNPHQTETGDRICDLQVECDGESVSVEIKGIESKDEIQSLWVNSLKHQVAKYLGDELSRYSVSIRLKKVLDQSCVNQCLLALEEVFRKPYSVVSHYDAPKFYLRLRRVIKPDAAKIDVSTCYSQDKYRAIKSNVNSAIGQLPEDKAGVVHIVLPPDVAYDFYSSIESCYHYINDNLLKGVQNLAALCLDHIEFDHRRYGFVHKRYLAFNFDSERSLPESLNISLASVVIPTWNPRGYPFEITFTSKVDGPLGRLPGKEVELNWISSNHGCCQIRVFLRPSGALRIDYITKLFGKLVIEVYPGSYVLGRFHEYSMDFRPGFPYATLSIDGRQLDDHEYSVISSTKFPEIVSRLG
jgi:hypothetical protein